MNRKIMGIAGAVVLAGMGTAVLMAYVESAHDEALAGEASRAVLVASGTIEKGTRAEDAARLATTRQMPVNAVVAGAITSLSPVAGKVTTADILPGEQLSSARFADARTVNGAAPAGLLLVTVSLDPDRALGGAVKAGDTVGVLASFDPQRTHLMLHKVPVTRVQLIENANAGRLGRKSEKPAEGEEAPPPSGQMLVTLALDAPSVERVVFAAEHGTLWLSSEPTEANEGGTRVQTPESIF